MALDSTTGGAPHPAGRIDAETETTFPTSGEVSIKDYRGHEITVLDGAILIKDNKGEDLRINVTREFAQEAGFDDVAKLLGTAAKVKAIANHILSIEQKVEFKTGSVIHASTDKGHIDKVFTPGGSEDTNVQSLIEKLDDKARNLLEEYCGDPASPVFTGDSTPVDSTPVDSTPVDSTPVGPPRDLCLDLEGSLEGPTRELNEDEMLESRDQLLALRQLEQVFQSDKSEALLKSLKSDGGDTPGTILKENQKLLEDYAKNREKLSECLGIAAGVTGLGAAGGGVCLACAAGGPPGWAVGLVVGAASGALILSGGKLVADARAARMNEKAENELLSRVELGDKEAIATLKENVVKVKKILIESKKGAIEEKQNLLAQGRTEEWKGWTTKAQLQAEIAGLKLEIGDLEGECAAYEEELEAIKYDPEVQIVSLEREIEELNEDKGIMKGWNVFLKRSTRQKPQYERLNNDQEIIGYIDETIQEKLGQIEAFKGKRSSEASLKEGLERLMKAASLGADSFGNAKQLTEQIQKSIKEIRGDDLTKDTSKSKEQQWISRYDDALILKKGQEIEIQRAEAQIAAGQNAITKTGVATSVGFVMATGLATGGASVPLAAAGVSLSLAGKKLVGMRQVSKGEQRKAKSKEAKRDTQERIRQMKGEAQSKGISEDFVTGLDKLERLRSKQADIAGKKAAVDSKVWTQSYVMGAGIVGGAAPGLVMGAVGHDNIHDDWGKLQQDLGRHDFRGVAWDVLDLSGDFIVDVVVEGWHKLESSWDRVEDLGHEVKDLSVDLYHSFTEPSTAQVRTEVTYEGYTGSPHQHEGKYYSSGHGEDKIWYKENEDGDLVRVGEPKHLQTDDPSVGRSGHVVADKSGSDGTHIKFDEPAAGKAHDIGHMSNPPHQRVFEQGGRFFTKEGGEWKQVDRSEFTKEPQRDCDISYNKGGDPIVTYTDPEAGRSQDVGYMPGHPHQRVIERNGERLTREGGEWKHVREGEYTKEPPPRDCVVSLHGGEATITYTEPDAGKAEDVGHMPGHPQQRVIERGGDLFTKVGGEWQHVEGRYTEEPPRDCTVSIEGGGDPIVIYTEPHSGSVQVIGQTYDRHPIVSQEGQKFVLQDGKWVPLDPGAKYFHYEEPEKTTLSEGSLNLGETENATSLDGTRCRLVGTTANGQKVYETEQGPYLIRDTDGTGFVKIDPLSVNELKVIEGYGDPANHPAGPLEMVKGDGLVPIKPEPGLMTSVGREGDSVVMRDSQGHLFLVDKSTHEIVPFTGDPKTLDPLLPNDVRTATYTPGENRHDGDSTIESLISSDGRNVVIS